MFKHSIFLYFLVNSLFSLRSAYFNVDKICFDSDDDFNCCYDILKDIKIVVDLICNDLEKKDGVSNEVQDEN